MRTIDDIIRESSKVQKRNICYLNDKNEVVEEKNATKCIITEYDGNGNVVNEIFGEVEEKKAERTYDEEER